MKKILYFFVLLSVFLVLFKTFSDIKNTSTDSDFSNNIDFSTMSMACIGSSSTIPVKVDKAYPTVVKEMLGLRRVFNYGVSWSTLAYKEDCHCHPDSEYDHSPYVYRYLDMQKADIIIVQGGGHNDYGCLIPIGTPEDNTPNTFYGGLNILLSGLKRNFPDSYIVVMTGFNTYGDTGSSSDAKNADGVYYREYANAILKSCKNHNIDCLDVYHNLPFDRETDTVDRTHPTQEYINKVWSPAIVKFIKSNYKK